MKYVPYKNLSKKEKKRLNATKRKLWSDYGCFCPVSKVIPDKRKQKNKNLCRDHSTREF